jgi:hypothetical protein
MGCRITEKLVRNFVFRWINSRTDVATQRQKLFDEANATLAKWFGKYKVKESESKNVHADSGAIEGVNSIRGDELEAFFRDASVDDFLAKFCPFDSNQQLQELREMLQSWKTVLVAAHKQQKEGNETKLNEIQTAADRFGIIYTKVFGNDAVTPYIHIAVCHIVPLLKALSEYVQKNCSEQFLKKINRSFSCSSLGNLQNQALEAAHSIGRQLFSRASRHRGGRGDRLWTDDLMLRWYRPLIMRTMFWSELAPPTYTLTLPKFENPKFPREKRQTRQTSDQLS